MLTKACAAFDAGDDDQIVILAGLLRLMLTDELIDKVTPLKEIEFSDSAEHFEDARTVRGYGYGITRIMVYADGQSGGRIVAPLGGPFRDSEPPTLPFERWWAIDHAVYPTNGPFLTREYIVYEMANTDGIHVDGLLDENYEALTQDNHGFKYNDHPITGNLATAAIRQIAWETQHTLHRALPELCGSDFPEASPCGPADSYWRVAANVDDGGV
ncbi:hypothetical protein [Mycolicibacterium sphagni]|uniref:Uncharacterized protein n=1 Tax=Mycolicibacterium sphagni TaxID=1786 RepID=A0A255DKI9_9MYCO|nr:hypothetical protein [Mycolicibacterium sphagni]OYN79979.1 hypothetical protein CG716_11010 [Mycolicibacterium sphagni]